jgi:hypothetical protein
MTTLPIDEIYSNDMSIGHLLSEYNKKIYGCSIYKWYVASSSKNFEEVKAARAILKLYYQIITHEWDKINESDLIKKCNVCVVNGAKDTNGVKDCDIFLLLNHPAACGALSELGMALALDKQVVVYDAFTSGYPDNIFFYDKRIIFIESLDDIISVLKLMENRHGS